MPYHIGTGSWADPEYRKLLIAPGIPASDRLRAYAAWFDHVEVNASFHRIPPPKTTATWAKQTPAGFTFDFKLHRNVCEAPQAAAAEARLMTYTRESVRPLVEAGRFGCFLLLMTGRFKPGGKRRLEELDALADQLAPHALAVELRHNAWVTGDERERTLAYFRTRQLVWVAVDMPRLVGSTVMPAVDEVTRDGMAYLRLHGRNPAYNEVKTTEEKHTYAYSAAEIQELATRARALARRAEHVRVIANNHARDFAPRTALALQRELRPERAQPAPLA